MQPHILFVDDEAPIRETLSLFFREKGFEVTTAANAGEGLRLLESGNYDLAILDIDVAGEGGLALLDNVKSKHPTLPVMMLTGLGCDPVLLQQALKLGANGFMEKTEPLAKLFAAVQKLIHTV